MEKKVRKRGKSQPKPPPVNEQELYDLNCPICLCIMVEPATLTCSHRYCIQCIRQQKYLKSICPMCRSEMDKEATAIDEEF